MAASTASVAVAQQLTHPTLRNQISVLAPGTKAPLRVVRGPAEVMLEIEVAKRPRQAIKAPEE